MASSVPQNRPFRSVASTAKVEGISSPGRGCVIAPPKGGSVEAQIERSTHLIASRLGCTIATIQKLAGLEVTTSTTTSARRPVHHAAAAAQPASARGGASATTTPRAVAVGAATTTTSPPGKKKDADALNALSLPPLPAHAIQKVTGVESHDAAAGAHATAGPGGLTIAQQQAAFLDDAEAARQFAAQLRFREAMRAQRKAPGVGQYEVPPITGADRESIYSRAPHISLDGQTPRSGRFVFNVDLYENGLKRPGPGEYFGDGTVSSARYNRTVAGRDRSMRKRTAMERLNPRMPIDMSRLQQHQPQQQQTRRQPQQGPGRTKRGAGGGSIAFDDPDEH